MGACLSCLQHTNDDEYNETTSLLRNQDNQYTSDYVQEEQILKQQQRQQELASIVNELSDKLIDVTSFLSGGPSQSQMSITNSPNANPKINNDTILSENDMNDSHITTSNEYDQGKTFPYIYNNIDKNAVIQAAEDLDEETREACQVKLSDPLYLKF
ncbi:uncharacterized protein SPAPADRAFT_60971 [Spathaspora passalidarum NRRL Y-27907]|uniref:Uncharacterized protein n=1 Tax=Spathaspora passalidarum (strain NRRL Y-27907 / 11-Y1) TaxID=619300 RepID=G3AKN4_SPAPN|nr:uncharacterized protein SPAPADRAFT_60971 [Spathaspora passalidarum NRRL Y-27907]EGW33639.1 hypothetical protein SPAPADRAFT_60971 [Spathaspora passalidarum NRRL Y-27907]